MPVVPTTLLAAGTHAVEMPRLGLGVYKVPERQAADVVAHALSLGYRSIDTAALYENEEGVGEGLRRSGLDPEEVFVTTKVWNDRQGYDETLRAFDESAARLGRDVVDLYLIHWPCPERDLYVDTWRALLRLREEGRIRAAGVSNFDVPHLTRLVDRTGEAPAINQIELHPYLAQRHLRDVHAHHGIATEAWAPIGRGRGLLEDPVVVDVAARAGVTPAQAVLAWHLRHGGVAIPKSVTPERIEENLGAVEVELDDESVARLDGLDRGERLGPDPATMN